MSSPTEPAPPGTRLHDLLVGLADPLDRPHAARTLARHLGAEDLIVLVRDPEVGVLLPAPGFPQTLPGGRAWRAFLADCVSGGRAMAELLLPGGRGAGPALGIATRDQAVFVLLGGKPRDEGAGEVRRLLPLLAAALVGERSALTAEGHAATARQAAARATELALSLDAARRELRSALAEAEAAGRAKDQFLAVLSHELRTPLNPVLISVTGLLEDPGTPESLRPILEVVRRNIELEARLIDDLLDATRIRQGKLRLNRQEVDANTLVRQASEIFRAEIASKGLLLEVDLAAALPHVDADPARLQQIAWNLIKNAVKFTPAGGAVAVRSRNEDRPDGLPRLLVEVTDTGIGIEPGALARIFDAFDQGDPMVTGQFGGLGLGLAISRSLAEAHGGTLAAASAGRGHGATFTLALPTVPAPPPTKAADLTPSSTDATPAPSLGILLVEDNPDTLRVMARLLRGRGHRVATASGVAEALAVEAAEGPFELVISDIGLPDGSGLDLMRQIRGRSGSRGIALSGFGMDEDLRRSAEAGFVAHLTKPVDFAGLEAAIRQAASGPG